ncbi:flagella basal body P-ring formation protein FlgA [Novosphingobium sp.]|uniref:flagella basal body P-ring formation protein FlgA n=1 Tax=Novosphingobium sp. TaxID=1874826 RepID=UPI00333E8F2C
MTQPTQTLFRHLPVAVLACCLALSPAAHAAAIEDPAAIDRELATFTGAPVGAPGGAARVVDRRLRLNACVAPLALSWHGDAHASVVVECPDAGGWHIYVAVAGNTRQTAAAPVIERGQAVTVAVTGDGFSVSQPAEALESGAVGAWIRVRTQAKADPVQAQVVRPGLVELPVQ